jgi:ATP-dependent Lon protease
VKVLVEGAQRARLDRVVDEGDYLSAEATALAGEGGQPHGSRRDVPRAARAVRPVRQAQQKIPRNLTSMAGIDDGGRWPDAIAAHLPLKLEQKQEVLEMGDVGKRLEHLLGQLEAKSTSSRSRSASAAASSGRWRRASASTT